MNYHLQECRINTLNEIGDESDNSKYYRYNEIDFYYKKHDTSDRLLVSFHAANANTNKAPLPIFRGYNWKYNMLCISDKLLELSDDINLAWYLVFRTEEYKHQINIY